jgi:hypothetical protein
MSRLLPAGLVLALAACGDNLDGEAAPDAGVVPDLAEVPAACTVDRATGDRPDDRGLDQIRVLYVVAADGDDLALDTSGRLCDSVRAFATWFHGQTGAYLRLDTAGGAIDLGFARLARTDLELRGDDPANATVEHGTAFVRDRLERELAAAGLIAAGKLYAVYYGGTSAYSCGGGAWPPLVAGRVGAFYLGAAPYPDLPRCADGAWGDASLVPAYADYAMLHELMHTIGLVADDAPHEHTMGHVFDPAAPQPQRDLMYTPRPGMSDPPWASNARDGLVLDLAHDDYFESDTANDLAASSLLAPLAPAPRRPPGW